MMITKPMFPLSIIVITVMRNFHFQVLLVRIWHNQRLGYYRPDLSPPPPCIIMPGCWGFPVVGPPWLLVINAIKCFVSGLWSVFGCGDGKGHQNSITNINQAQYYFSSIIFGIMLLFWGWCSKAWLYISEHNVSNPRFRCLGVSYQQCTDQSTFVFYWNPFLLCLDFAYCYENYLELLLSSTKACPHVLR